jgi:hypothetical protein
MEELLLSLLYVIAEALLEALLEIVGEAVFALISRATGTYSPLCSNLTDSSLPSVLPSLALLPVFRLYWSFLIGSYSRPDSMASAC